DSSIGQFAKGMEYLRKAKALLEGLIQESPRNPSLTNGLSEVLQSMAQAASHLEPATDAALRYYEQAVTQARRSVALAPNDPNSRGILTDATISYLRHLIAVSPDRVTPGQVAEARGAVEEAAQGLKLGAERLSVLANAYSVEGQMYVRRE